MDRPVSENAKSPYPACFLFSAILCRKLFGYFRKVGKNFLTFMQKHGIILGKKGKIDTHMPDMSNHPPRDLPREEIIAMADNIVKRDPFHTSVYFKFTCEHCGERCTFVEPNVLYEKGECQNCGGVTVILKAGYMLVITREPFPTYCKN